MNRRHRVHKLELKVDPPAPPEPWVFVVNWDSQPVEPEPGSKVIVITWDDVGEELEGEDV